MTSRSKISIFQGIGRRLLLWFSLFFLIPLLTVGTAGYLQSKQAIRHHVFDHFQSIHTLQREALKTYIRQRETQLLSTVTENEFVFISAVVLQSSTFSPDDIQTAAGRLRHYLKDKNQDLGSRSLWITGRKGQVIAASDPAIVGNDRAQSPEVLGYAASPAPVLSRYTEVPYGPEILISTPIGGQGGEFLGLFTMSLTMKEIYQILLDRTGLGASGETYLVNKDGYMISPSRFLENAVLKKKIPLEEIYELDEWRNAERYPINYRGVPVIMAHTHLPVFDWTLIAEMESAEAFRELTAQRNRTLMIMAILFSVLVATAALISQNLTQPIRVLVEAARRVGEGDLSPKIEIPAPDELGELATEFNRMTERLRISKERMEAWNATIQAEVERRTQDLINSELKFRNLMEKANDAILIFDATNMLCTLANLAAEGLTGYSQEELLNLRFHDLFLPEDSATIQEHCRQARSTGSANLYTMPLRRRDGRHVFVDVSNSLIEFQNQRYINCILHDVTTQKNIAREREAVFGISDMIAKSSDLDVILQKSLENILYNLELEVGCVFVYEPRTRELVLNCQQGFSEAFEKDFLRQVVTDNANRICAQTVNTRETQILENPFVGPMEKYLTAAVRRDNLEAIVSFPLIAEGILVGVLQIVTRREREFSPTDRILLEAVANQLAAGIFRIKLEMEKHEGDQFLAGILTDSVDGIISMDTEDRITSWNRGAAKIFDMEKEEVLGKQFQSLFREPHLINQRRIREELHRKGFVKDYEIKNISRDGRELILQFSQTALRDQTGRFMGTSAVIRDITEQHRMRERIQQSEKLSSIGQLAAGIAHEIGTPLNIISGNAEYLMMDMKAHDSRMEELSIIINQTDRITRLIQQLMDFARETPPRWEETDINELIENTLILVRHQLKKRSIALASSLHGAMPRIVADPYQLQQVLLNIIMNAIQAMSDKGTLTIETAFDAPRDEVRVTVRDTGSGIAPEHIKSIFNPFFTTKEVGQGTGLGLSVSHRIIENHNGRIEVESQVEKGSLFTLTLPRCAREVPRESRSIPRD